MQRHHVGRTLPDGRGQVNSCHDAGWYCFEGHVVKQVFSTLLVSENHLKDNEYDRDSRVKSADETENLQLKQNSTCRPSTTRRTCSQTDERITILRQSTQVLTF